MTAFRNRLCTSQVVGPYIRPGGAGASTPSPAGPPDNQAQLPASESRRRLKTAGPGGRIRTALNERFSRPAPSAANAGSAPSVDPTASNPTQPPRSGGAPDQPTFAQAFGYGSSDGTPTPGQGPQRDGTPATHGNPFHPVPDGHGGSPHPAQQAHQAQQAQQTHHDQQAHHNQHAHHSQPDPFPQHSELPPPHCPPGASSQTQQLIDAQQNMMLEQAQITNSQNQMALATAALKAQETAVTAFANTIEEGAKEVAELAKKGGNIAAGAIG